MKSSSLSIVLIAFFLGLPLKSLGQNTSEIQLIGTWAFNYKAALESMDSNAKEVFNNLSQSQRTGIENMYKGRQMIFTNDTFKLKLTDGRSSEGAWELNPSGNVLKIKNEVANKVYPYKLHVISDGKLVIEELDAKGNMYFKELHFVKLNN